MSSGKPCIFKDRFGPFKIARMFCQRRSIGNSISFVIKTRSGYFGAVSGEEYARQDLCADCLIYEDSRRRGRKT